MSFSSELKNELGKVIDNPRHCRIAELAAIMCMSGVVRRNDKGKYVISVSLENPIPAEVCSVLLRKVFDMETEIEERRSNRNLTLYSCEIEEKDSVDVANALKIRIRENKIFPDVEGLTENNCCRRAFLRGAFITSGSISDPDRHYHLEIPCRDTYTAQQIMMIMNKLNLEPKMVERQNHYVVYLKDSEQIADALGFMGARKSLLELENARIRREVRGNINRRVNCETANINKTAHAAARQIDDILLIQEKIGLSSLPMGLDEMARVRLKYPEASLSELGAHLEPPVGKSGVNHRLRKLGEIAASLKCREGELL